MISKEVEEALLWAEKVKHTREGSASHHCLVEDIKEVTEITNLVRNSLLSSSPVDVQSKMLKGNETIDRFRQAMFTAKRICNEKTKKVGH